MKMQSQKTQFGFTLVELMVAMAVGLIAMAAMASLFKTGMNTVVLVQQRAETQQNMRAAIDLIVKDVSLAGAGLPTGGVQLPVGIVSKYGCDQTLTCYVPNDSYPTGNFMYGIIPGFSDGVESSAIIPAAPTAVNDSITIVYADYNFPLWEYDLNFVSGSNGGEVSAAVDAQYTATPPPAINAAGGIQVGDLIMVNGAGGLTAMGEVTKINSTNIWFANVDPLNINDSSAASGNLNAIQTVVGTGTSVTGYRLYAVTYYLMVPGGFQTPRLMRQVNGLTPVPVADDIINLQFTYDVYNSSVTPATLDPNQANPIGAGESPNNIQKVNILIIGESINNWGNKSQSLSLATSVSAGNMTYRSQQYY